ncbi:MAG: aldo/keto reductase [Candidatus Cloacimonadaceae bacterium]|nr:aldo/keto reductase [Candidatus Cloacimonadaceae bacterium]
MRYRIMPGSREKLSVLGFGCMRFHTDAEGKIIEDEAMEMLRHAYDKGINYFDTAWPYHNGESEPLLGRFLQTIDRSKVYVATKLPSWLIQKPEDMMDYLNQQLQKLQTDYIDYYLVHALNVKFWSNLKQQKLFDYLDEAKAKGLIRKVGFSFHDSYSLFRKIVDAYPWDFCQIMLNYLDTSYQAGLKGMKYAASKGLGIVIMEPLRGGKLVDKIPDEVTDIWKKSPMLLSPVERSLHWIWHHKVVQVILRGMSSLAQIKENIAIAGKSKAGYLPESELRRYMRARKAYLKRIKIHCSFCRYCLPCPSNLPIPFIFEMYNDAFMFDDKARLLHEYKLFLGEETRADKCTKCGACLQKCPRQIDIPSRMQEIAEFFQ